jgi:hypothetical protein
MPGAPHDFAIGGTVWPGTSKLIEEIGEVAQVLGKLIATGGDIDHWDGAGPLNRRLIDELGDVLGAIAFFEAVNFTPTERIDIHARAEEKRLLFEGWHYAAPPAPEPPAEVDPWGHVRALLEAVREVRRWETGQTDARTRFGRAVAALADPANEAAGALAAHDAGEDH